ncbi:hypothetical protein X777_03614 [Ooceraea biroi]|uniref:Transmembrane protein n=1 Tax=Ooceraea biroi TaxID=2015173 RepID=A0A026WLF1_OOCBI|nr:hypothetical protein X777_03614 [Ooceraea biroi]
MTSGVNLLLRVSPIHRYYDAYRWCNRSALRLVRWRVAVHRPALHVCLRLVLLLVILLLVLGLAYVHRHLIRLRFRPLEIDPETDVVAIRSEFPEQARAVLVRWHSYGDGLAMTDLDDGIARLPPDDLLELFHALPRPHVRGRDGRPIVHIVGVVIVQGHALVRVLLLVTFARRGILGLDVLLVLFLLHVLDEFLVLVQLLHVLVIVLLLQLPDQNALLFRVARVLLLGVHFELIVGLLIQSVLDLSPVGLLSQSFFLLLLPLLLQFLKLPVLLELLGLLLLLESLLLLEVSLLRFDHGSEQGTQLVE